MTDHRPTPSEVVIIGGGPAGLTAAYELVKLGWRPRVLEKQSKVGGLACTENYKGYYFDMGGHRFFTKVQAVDRLWREVIGDDFLRRPRLSRIFYNRRFFHYPLRPLNALLGLGIWQSLLVLLSYLRWQFLPHRRVESFEHWVTNRFGARLFATFFKTYTEKVWGIPCSELKAEWAAQRIKDLSLKTAVVSMFRKPGRSIKTLIEEFDYPRRGPGMMWTAFQNAIERAGGHVQLNTDVVAIRRHGNRVTSVIVSINGEHQEINASYFISSMPLAELIIKLDPLPPPAVLAAARKLSYRDFLTVCVIVNTPHLFADNWIYVHDPSVRVGRIQNFKNWSAEMVPHPDKTSLGLEYFCTEGDDLWNMTDADLIELARRELDQVGLASYTSVEDGVVFRVPKSYPIYDSDYSDQLDVIRRYISSLENFQTIGRNGLHRYNNQDHSMLTAMLAVRNLVRGECNDVWTVNTDQEYHEQFEAVESVLRRTVLRLDRVAFGLSLGLAAALVLFLTTLLASLSGSHSSSLGLHLLDQFFPGYSVTPLGSLVGLGYGFLLGLTVGWLFASIRNGALFISVVLLTRGLEPGRLRRIFDYM